MLNHTLFIYLGCRVNQNLVANRTRVQRKHANKYENYANTTDIYYPQIINFSNDETNNNRFIVSFASNANENSRLDRLQRIIVNLILFMISMLMTKICK